MISKRAFKQYVSELRIAHVSFTKTFSSDLVGYRFCDGHNEADQPASLHSRECEADVIKSHPSVREVWAARLVRERVVTEDQAKSIDKSFADAMGSVFAQVKSQARRGVCRTSRFVQRSRNPIHRPPWSPEQLVALNDQLHTWPCQSSSCIRRCQEADLGASA